MSSLNYVSRDPEKIQEQFYDLLSSSEIIISSDNMELIAFLPSKYIISSVSENDVEGWLNHYLQDNDKFLLLSTMIPILALTSPELIVGNKEFKEFQENIRQKIENEMAYNESIKGIKKEKGKSALAFNKFNNPNGENYIIFMKEKSHASMYFKPVQEKFFEFLKLIVEQLSKTEFLNTDGMDVSLIIKNSINLRKICKETLLELK